MSFNSTLPPSPAPINVVPFRGEKRRALTPAEVGAYAMASRAGQRQSVPWFARDGAALDVRVPRFAWPIAAAPARLTLTLSEEDVDRIADALVAAVLREAGISP